MVEKRSRRLQPVHRLEQLREEKALEVLAAAMGQVRSAQARLDQLEAFSAEYRARMLAPGQRRMAGADLQGMARFQSHLGGLIEAQQVILRKAETRLAEARAHWSGAHARQRAVESVIDRFRDLERIEAARREQRESDELGLRRRRADAPPPGKY